jgi:mono/diheme cytochrome c family protein
MFKIKSTPGMALPTDEDLFNTVTRGMPGSSIPSFTCLTEKERRDAVQYVKFLTAFTDAPGKRLNRFEEAKKDDQLAKPIEVPPEPPVTVQSLAEGARLFSKLNCVLCHGETGAGDGPNAPSLKDTQGDAANRNPATPAHTNPATGRCRYGKLIHCGVGLGGVLFPRSGCRASGGWPGNGRRQNSSPHFLDAGASIR